VSLLAAQNYTEQELATPEKPHIPNLQLGEFPHLRVSQRPRTNQTYQRVKLLYLSLIQSYEAKRLIVSCAACFLIGRARWQARMHCEIRNADSQYDEADDDADYPQNDAKNFFIFLLCCQVYLFYLLYV
jgi:hypothetical protein